MLARLHVNCYAIPRRAHGFRRTVTANCMERISRSRSSAQYALVLSFHLSRLVAKAFGRRFPGGRGPLRADRNGVLLDSRQKLGDNVRRQGGRQANACGRSETEKKRCSQWTVPVRLRKRRSPLLL